uniref:Glutathione synthetase n=1 Tax=Theileria annulata TaxID=5874 RepID=A0A3B0N096_THEAN
MAVFLPELTKLLKSLVVCKNEENPDKIKIPSDYPLLPNERNFEICVDATRNLLFKGGMIQKIELINDLEENSSEKYQLEAYDGILTMVNFVLFPLPFPLKCYQDCCLASTILVEIVDEMSMDLELLNDVFSQLLKYDKFVRDLLEISNEVYGTGGRSIKDDLRTYICRSDYFIHIDGLSKNNSQEENQFCKSCYYDHCLCSFSASNHTKENKQLEFKLVECNNTASSVSHHSELVHKVHEKLLKTNLVDVNDLEEEQAERLLLEKEKLHIYNNPDTCFSYAIYESHKMYINKYKPIFGKNRVCVFLVVRDNLNNYYDTYFIANDMFDRYGVHVKTVCPKQMICWMKKKTLLLVSEWEHNSDGTVKLLKYDDCNNKLHPGRLVVIMNSQSDPDRLNKLDCFEVSTVYSRDYYDPKLMESDERVLMRKFLEFSDAIKIPTSVAQLVNTKRAQMYFSKPQNIERLVALYNNRVKGVKRNTDNIELVKQTTILQVDPSLESSSEVLNDAIQNPSDYILKSNGEGGSACTFGAEISEKLRTALSNREELCQYVLMKKIKTPSQPALFVKNLKNGSFEVKGHNSLTELGIYHYALYDGSECKANEFVGYLARTKPEFVTGGGIGAGFGFVNSLLLF